MWTKTTINGFQICVKHFDEGSVYGINEGRISKLDIRKNGKIYVLYERDWEIKPTDAQAKAVYEQVLKQYN